MSQDFKKLVEENKKQTNLLNKIAGEEGTENAVEALAGAIEQQGKDARRVAAGEKAWQTRQARQNSVNESAETESKREQGRLFSGILESVSGMKSGIMGLGGMFKDKFKEGASSLGGGLKGMLGKLLIGGALAAFVAFMNSPYWEKFKTLLQDTIAPALVAVYDNVLKPIWDVGLSAIFALFEDIGVLFEDIGLAITDFKNGDILGGISKLIGGLGTFFMNTVDNLITSVVNLFAGLFGLEKTDSVFGAIGGFIDDTWTSIKGFFVDLYDGVVGIFTDPVGTLTSMWNGIVGEGGLLDIIFKPIDLAVNWIMGVFGFSTEDGTDFSLKTFIGDSINFYIDKVKALFALGEETFGDWQIFKFAKGIIDDVISSVKAIFSGDFSAENFYNLFGSLMDIFYAPVNLAVNALKDIFGFGDPDEPFRLSDFVLETFQKIGDFFKSLLDIDVRGLASGIMPEAVVDFLFGKKVDQNSAEFKAMTPLEQAEAMGIYDKDLIGNSEVNEGLLKNASDAQLQAILDDDDISDEMAGKIRALQASRSGAGEFSGSGQYEEKKLNAYEKKMQKLENKRGEQLNRSSTEAQEERAQAKQNLTLIQQKQGLHPREMAMMNRGGGQVAVPVPIKDTSSAATAATSSGF
jgi:hypothetical protein